MSRARCAVQLQTLQPQHAPAFCPPPERTRVHTTQPWRCTTQVLYNGHTHQEIAVERAVGFVEQVRPANLRSGLRLQPVSR